jgi:hypothetical protein
MKVEQLAISKTKAQAEYEAYKEELRYGKTQFNKDMLSLYAHMKHGGKVIDLWEAMKLAGLNEQGDPKLAIVRADCKRVRFNRDLDATMVNGKWKIVNNGGSFLFQKENRYHDWVTDVHIPKEFFEWPKDQNGEYIRRTVETITPIIPAKIMNPLRSHKLQNYHILWEVDAWEPIPPRDPMLLKRITPNMFCVLATWNLTELERAVIRGRI